MANDLLQLQLQPLSKVRCLCTYVSISGHVRVRVFRTHEHIASGRYVCHPYRTVIYICHKVREMMIYGYPGYFEQFK